MADMSDDAPYIDPGLLSFNERATNYYGVPYDQTSGRLRLARRAGEQYAGKREVFEVAGYPSEHELDSTDGALEYFRSQYERGDVAGRIIDLPPKTCWGTPPSILGPDGEDIPFTDEFEQFADRTGLWRIFERTDRLAGLGYYALLLIGVRGTADDRALQQPMERVGSLDDVMLLKPYSQEWVEIQGWDNDTTSPRFGLPELYGISVGGGINEFPANENLLVHHTRILHVAEDLLDDDVYGRPRLKRVFNRLKDLEKVLASTGEGYWQQASRILNVKLDPEAKMSDKDLETLMNQMGEIQHDLRRHFAAGGADLEFIGGMTPDPSGAVDALKEMISAACDIPTRILFGSQSGERASTEDRKAWLGQMADRQRNHCEPTFIRALLDRLKRFGAPVPDDYTIYWPPLHEESRAEIAEGNYKTAQTAQALTPVGGDPSVFVEIDADGVVSLAPLDAAEVVDDTGEPDEGFLPAPDDEDPDAE